MRVLSSFFLQSLSSASVLSGFFVWLGRLDWRTSWRSHGRVAGPQSHRFSFQKSHLECHSAWKVMFLERRVEQNVYGAWHSRTIVNILGREDGIQIDEVDHSLNNQRREKQVSIEHRKSLISSLQMLYNFERVIAESECLDHMSMNDSSMNRSGNIRSLIRIFWARNLTGTPNVAFGKQIREYVREWINQT